MNQSDLKAMLEKVIANPIDPEYLFEKDYIKFLEQEGGLRKTPDSRDMFVAAAVCHLVWPMIEALRAERDAWQETAAQFSRNEDYYRGLIDSAAPNLGSPMYTQDDGGVVPEPLRACLPKAVAALKARVAELEQEIVAHDHTIAEIGERAATLRARLTEAEESADLHFCRAERAEAEVARLRKAGVRFCDDFVSRFSEPLTDPERGMLRAAAELRAALAPVANKGGDDGARDRAGAVAGRANGGGRKRGD